MQNIPAMLEEAQAEEIPESECRTGGASGGAVPAEDAGESRAQQKQDDKETEGQQSSTRLPGAITTTSNEKLDTDGGSPMGDLTVSEQRDAPRSKASKTGCSEYWTKSGRVLKPPRWLGDTIHLAYRDSIEKKRPAQFEIAKEKGMDWWQDFCCLSAYHALKKNGTWKLVPRRKGMKVLGNRWIFRVKYLPNGEIERFKARLVVKGFMQVYGVDYLEVYSPVVRLETLRMLLTLAAIWDYEVDQMDVTTAFLNGSLDGEVYMEQPKGYEESCVAVKVVDGELVFISIYVDDLILFTPNKKLMNELKQTLHVRFEMKDLGPIHYILGWEITRNRKERTIFINQRKYADKVLHRFEMERCNGCKVPSTPDLKLSKVMCPTTKVEKDFMSGKPYRALIGSLMYLMLGTRPDLAYLVRECSQFLESSKSPYSPALCCLLLFIRRAV
ncbi:unnamed protein product [Phytophthora fragariaefolia]|uniref:Unnamed protein product n=1 Tax=Phytophthora fragariaefolia TaxID=1490495 RepID=A0A9W6XD37_9STRA|nr:unnamed protein product [Phytophthora fragariaefolia]